MSEQDEQLIETLNDHGHAARAVPPFADPLIQVRTKDGQRFDLARGADGTMELLLVTNGFRLTPEAFDALAVIRESLHGEAAR